MNRPVAIKVPTAALLATTQAREQFLHEARSVARLRHANIVTAHDFGQEANGRCYLVYDFIEGTSLADRLRQARCRRARGRRPGDTGCRGAATAFICKA